MTAKNASAAAALQTHPSKPQKGGGGGSGPKKTRFDGLDVAAMTAHVRRTLLGHRLANVYDGEGGEGDKNTYLFKLADTSAGSASNKAAEGGGGGRSMLLVESGVRFHTTASAPGGGDGGPRAMPSPFAMKLRKHLRGLRLENAVQLGNLDRVVDFRFGSGDNSHHVMLELYARGNLVLTDGGYKILALLRVHEYAASKGGGGEKEKTKAGGGDSSSTTGGEEEVKVRVGNVYPVTYATTLSAGGKDEAHEKGTTAAGAAESASAGDGEADAAAASSPAGSPPRDSDPDSAVAQRQVGGLLSMDGPAAHEWARSELDKARKWALDQKAKQAAKGGGVTKKGKKAKKKGGGGDDGAEGGLNLKALLLKPSSGAYHLGPSLIEHCILCANLQPGLKMTVDNLEHTMPVAAWSDLLEALRDEGHSMVDRLSSGEGGGYIFYRPKAEDDKDAGGVASGTPPPAIPHSDKVFEEFQPHLLRQHGDRPRLPFSTFSEAVDIFFGLIEGQRRVLRLEAAEVAAREKLERVRRDQERRVEELEVQMERMREHAQLVKCHASDVDKAIGVVNSALDSGMDWDALNELVEVEKENRNPIAMLIKRLDPDKDSMVLALPDVLNLDEEDDDVPAVDVSVSLTESAFGNARDMFARYKASKEKSQKTVEASTKALKAAEATAWRQLEEAQRRKNAVLAVAPARRRHWFEKFNWFVTGDDYLVVAGKDAQQNEQIVKRYLRPGDAYLHADIHGAASVVLRAKRRRLPDGKTEVLPLSDRALRDAGNFTVCRSSAWSSRMVTSAWWVESHQVSKTAPTGEYLTVGSFMVRGKKNFLPPSQLEMGMGVLFRLGDEPSVTRHSGERRDFALMELETSERAIAEEQEKEEKIRDRAPKARPAQKNDVDFSSDDLVSEKSPVTISDVVESTDEGGLADESSRGNDDSVGSGIDSAAEGGDASLASSIGGKGQPSLPPPRAMKNTMHYEASGEEEAMPAQAKKRGYSARDRKLMRRYRSLGAAEHAVIGKRLKEEAEAARNEEASSSEKAHPLSPEKKEEHKSAPKQMPITRGKKAKMKKAAKKYADQDDEDRELAMQALHGGEGKRSKKKDRSGGGSRAGTMVSTESSTQRKAAEDTVALLIKDSLGVASRLPDDVRAILADCVTTKSEPAVEGESTPSVRWDKFDADVLEQLIAVDSKEAQLAVANRLRGLTQSTRVDNFSSSLAGILRTIKRYGHENLAPVNEDVTDGKQRKTKAEKLAEKEAWREILAEDGIIDDEGKETDGAVDDRAELGKLTGKPHPDDVLLYAIPVCAPYQTIAQYKYRVKLTPGSQKRGKASKQCVEMFVRGDGADKNSQASGRMRELIKAVGDNDWVQVMCGDVKLSAAGASKAAKKQKAAKKGKKK